MTGFRVSRSGWYGIDPVAADLFTFGKVMSGGLPAAAFGGRADVMERLAPLGPVYQAGTLSGNPVAMAAGLATLRAADQEVYRALDHNADRLAGLLAEALTDAGVPHQIPRGGNMLSVFFSETPVTDFASARASQTWRYAAVLPCAAGRGRLSAVQCLRGVVRLGGSRRQRVRPDRRRSARRCPGRRRAKRGGVLMAEQTRVHVVRHGEVHNPTGVLYGRLPGFHLSERGRAQAAAVADFAGRPRRRRRDRLPAAAGSGNRGTHRRPATTCRWTPIRT